MATAGQGTDLELVNHLPRVVRVFQTLAAEDREIITEGVQTLARGMCRYATRAAVRAELVVTKRGALVTYQQIAIVTGITVSYFVNYFIKKFGGHGDQRLVMSGRAGREDLCLLGWPRRLRSRLRQGRPSGS